MAGWINDYKMDYSPVVNALNARYKDRAEQRQFMLDLLNKAVRTGLIAKMMSDDDRGGDNNLTAEEISHRLYGNGGDAVAGDAFGLNNLGLGGRI